MATEMLDPPQTANLLAQVKALLTQLSPTGKRLALQWFVEDRNGRIPNVQHTPGVCGGSACVRRMRIPVWLLEEARRTGISDSDLLLDYPDLTAADLVRAWAYVAANPHEIEDELRRQEEA